MKIQEKIIYITPTKKSLVFWSKIHNKKYATAIKYQDWKEIKNALICINNSLNLIERLGKPGIQYLEDRIMTPQLRKKMPNQPFKNFFPIKFLSYKYFKKIYPNDKL